MLKNTVALVTGGFGTLGFATCKKLIQEGCRVMIMDLEHSTHEEKLETLGKNALYKPGNVTSTEDVENVMFEISRKFHKLDVIVNCAGISQAKVVYNFVKKKSNPISSFKEIFDVNVYGAMNVNRIGCDLMVKNIPNEDGLRGVIINTGGLAGTDGQIGQSALAASCGAIEALTLPFARELGPVGIRVMTIAPGLINSPLLKIIPSEKIDVLTEFVPSPKRLGKPEEFAHQVKSIIENPYLNGTTIKLDGGLKLYLFN